MDIERLIVRMFVLIWLLVMTLLMFVWTGFAIYLKDKGGVVLTGLGGCALLYLLVIMWMA